jgi:type I restriction enzyme, S subunit
MSKVDSHPNRPLDYLFPEDWRVRSLGEIADIGSGVTLGRKLPSNGTLELPYLRVFNVQDGFLDLSEVKHIRVLSHEVDRYLLRSGDLLMTEGGDFDKLGRGTVWRGQIDPCLHQNHIFRVRPKQDLVLPDFLAAVSASEYGKRYFQFSDD